MAVSLCENVLNAVLGMLGGAVLDGTTPVPVILRKLPTDQDTLETTPVICVCPAETPEESDVISFEHLNDVVFCIEIAGVMSCASYAISTNVALLLRQVVRRMFSGVGENALVPGWWGSRVEMDVPIDRSMLSANYDYTLMRVFVYVTESTA